MPIHVTRAAVGRFGLEGRVSFVGGKIDLPDIAASRLLAELLAGAPEPAASRAEPAASRAEPAASRAEPAVSTAELYALARLEEVLQLLVSRHLRERDPGALESFLRGLAKSLGEDEAERALAIFGADFSLPAARDVLVRELLVWAVLDENPALGSATRALYAGSFKADPVSAAILAALDAAAADDADEIASGRALLEALRAPARAAPDSIEAQLRFILERFGDVVGIDHAGFLRGLDLLAEEAKRVDLAPGPGPASVPAFEELDEEEENYSPDRSWMPSVVLLAKNVYVWLDQMSKRYGRAIERLDQVPAEELDEIAARGFSSLWLIGVWERSAASERLKRMCGNPEAVASAYSLRGYRVAESLGGEDALTDLSQRAGRRGLRLAADMVPNHMGIDSDWLLEHPERFLSLAESPFSAYRFAGPDLSPDPRVGIHVEDHYFDRSDAAVVFKRVDRATGETRYVYHGNDGTTMPWNDTAQLDYLNPQTREAVIETILEVARRFPVIRFDAAMTLARRHYERLWFPAPGEGGAIPSRAEHGLSPERFAELMPREFWREVVDRVAREAPDTLLLAEAFWLMEGYFVRTLGMHRVYNSAFMNMLRDGDNAKYRRLVKETLAFDPQILQRYVNFLTNPDEAPAVEQFGDGDRYFGACVLLATLPGLPMFGHGQIEGHGEKYGMEYRRAYREEEPRPEIVARHEREIVPLLRRRRLFAGVDAFELYDFVGEDGEVNENVFAFSNQDGQDRALVLFNNSGAAGRGRVGRSADRDSRPGLSLAEGLGLDPAPDRLWVFRDAISGLSYLRWGLENDGGWRLELPAFGCRVYEGFRSIGGEEQERYGRLERKLAGAGVADLESALDELDLEPAAAALRELLAERIADGPDTASPDDLVEPLTTLLGHLEPAESLGDRAARLARRLAADLEAVAGLEPLERLEREAAFPESTRLLAARDRLGDWLSTAGTRPALSILVVLGALLEEGRAGERLGRLAFGPIVRDVLAALGLPDARLDRVAAVVEAVARRGWTRETALPAAGDLAALPRSWSAEAALGPLIGFHRAEGSGWVWREGFEDLVAWRLAPAVALARASAAEPQEQSEEVVAWFDAIETVVERLEAAGYRVELSLEESSSATSATSE